jgi:hypothetical protein
MPGVKSEPFSVREVQNLQEKMFRPKSHNNLKEKQGDF